jgi:predicted patatin/cPLA2 family phospholipase
MPSSFTLPDIKGTKHETILPRGTALVLEGGGTRGFYSAGVFEAFMDAGIMFPYIIGVSAGIANALTYVAGQRGRNRAILERYVGNHKYVSRRNMLRQGSLFGYDFIFKTIPEQHVFFDREVFENTDIRFLTGAIDCRTGETVWFEKEEITPGFAVTVASCSIPLLSKIVKHKGLELLDGGVGSPIPIEKSMEDGNTFHVIVLTRNQGYIKPAFRHKTLLKLVYRKYPKLIDTVMKWHEAYNRQLALCEQLEREGKALIIRPLLPLSVDRSAADTHKLLTLYDEGHREGKQAITGLIASFAQPLHGTP